MASLKFYEHIFYHPYKKNEIEFILNDEESQHISRTLRKNEGDLIAVGNGKGLISSCKITSINKKEVRVVVENVLREDNNIPKLSIAIGYLKGKDLEDVIEDCTQVELKEVVILSTDFSQEVKKANHDKMIERLRKKSVVSYKQAKKRWLTEICGPEAFDKWFDPARKYIYLDMQESNGEALHPGEEYWLLIGPEGGFSEREESMIKQTDSPAVNLGNTRFRAKSVGMFALGYVNHMLRSKEN